MPELMVSDLHKSFGSVRAVDDLGFALEEGEILALLGPSGCGKTTTLRLIAGFERPDRGRVVLHGRDLLPLPPEKRKIGFVFQNYALFPHMTVSQNIAYGIRFEPRHKERVRELIDLVDLAGLEHRYPRELSSGQCQRVALARALAPRPRLLLLDEPLSALDAKLRESLRREIRRIQQEVKLATLHVTHDQDEAMAISDRMAVMHAGRIEQIGTASEIYSHPNSAFVASFIGQANVISGTITSSGNGAVEIDASGLRLSVSAAEARFNTGDKVLLFCKQEVLRLGGAGENCVDAEVILTEYHGDTVIVHLKSRVGPLRVRISAANTIDLSTGTETTVSLPPAACHLYPRSRDD